MIVIKNEKKRKNKKRQTTQTNKKPFKKNDNKNNKRCRAQNVMVANILFGILQVLFVNYDVNYSTTTMIHVTHGKHYEIAHAAIIGIIIPKHILNFTLQ